MGAHSRGIAFRWPSIAFATFCIVSLAVLLYQYQFRGIPLLFGTHESIVAEHGSTRESYATSYGSDAHWHGWSKTDHVFIFGDSWTTTGFEIDQAQPTVENPLGNPEWDPSHWHLGAGSNWVGFITARHNQSLVRTVNLAYGGATVNMDLIHPFAEKPPGMRDLGYQIKELFQPKYAGHPDYFDWTSDNSLFIIWIGLNDIHNADDKKSMLFGEVYEDLAKDVDELYQMGARNFLLMNIPPIDRSPLAPRGGPSEENMVENWASWVTAWNQNLTSLAMNFTRAHEDALFFVFDTYQLYQDILDHPCTFPETCPLKDTTTACVAYAWGTPDWNSKDPECDFRVDEYFWMNPIHPTTRVHNLTAHEMAKALAAG